MWARKVRRAFAWLDNPRFVGYLFAAMLVFAGSCIIVELTQP